MGDSRVVVVEGPDSGREIEISSSGSVIGRDPASCDVVIQDNGISRRHLKLSERGGSVLVEDLGSSNGTWISGRRVSGVQALGPGDQVRAGGTTFRVGEAVQETQLEAPAERPPTDRTRAFPGGAGAAALGGAAAGGAAGAAAAGQGGPPPQGYPDPGAPAPGGLGSGDPLQAGDPLGGGQGAMAPPPQQAPPSQPPGPMPGAPDQPPGGVTPARVRKAGQPQPQAQPYPQAQPQQQPQQPGMPPPVGGAPAPVPPMGAPPHGQPPHGQMHHGAAPAARGGGVNIAAIISVICALLSVVVMLVVNGPLFYAAIVFALVAIITGSVGKRMARRGQGMRGLAQTGFILGICFLLIAIAIAAVTTLINEVGSSGDNLQDWIKDLLGQ